jgi:RNA polymerase sigma factor (sigma-70 family)
MDANDEHNCPQQDLWAVAYRRYIRLWMNLALTVYPDVQEAEDIVHSVIQSAMGRPGDPFASLEHIRNYVAKAVLNRAGQHRQRVSKVGRWDDHADLAASSGPSILHLEDQEQHGALRQVMGKLPARDYEIVKLRYYSGFTFQEISDFLGLALSTVKSREESALRKIRLGLRKNGIEVLVISEKRGGK